MSMARAAAAAARKMKQQQLPLNSSNSASDKPPIRLAAAKGAEILIKLCRRRKDIPDIREFVFAIAYTLNA